MFRKAKGIVLRETDYKETDRILTVLTDEYGKLTLKARGVRGKSSRLKSGCQLLCYSELTLRDVNGYEVITEAEPIEMFQNLRTDIEKFSLSCYFAQVAELISVEDTPSPLLSVLLNAVYALNALNLPQQQVKAAFELKTACIAGFEPDLSSCAICGNPEPDRFSITSGTLQCSGCHSGDTHEIRLPISANTRNLARYIVSASEKRFLLFRSDAETLEQLNGITESFLAAQLEHSFSALDMYKSLFFNTFTSENL